MLADVCMLLDLIQREAQQFAPSSKLLTDFDKNAARKREWQADVLQIEFKVFIV